MNDDVSVDGRVRLGYSEGYWFYATNVFVCSYGARVRGVCNRSGTDGPTSLPFGAIPLAIGHFAGDRATIAETPCIPRRTPAAPAVGEHLNLSVAFHDELRSSKRGSNAVDRSRWRVRKLAEIAREEFCLCTSDTVILCISHFLRTGGSPDDL